MRIEDIALTMIPALGAKGTVRLLDDFGSGEELFRATETELRAAGRLRDDVVRAILNRASFGAAKRELDYCVRHGIDAVAAGDAEYPTLLYDIPDRPHVLYVKGERSVLQGRLLSMVGTRSMTHYGQDMCYKLIRELAERVPDLVIVSGIAAGCDAACHHAALECGLHSVAVLANPLPEVTPAAHRALADQIVAHGGALVTEFHSQTRQNGNLFPARNRIIAGLSAATVVVESAVGGGSLITADYANGYGRTVLAVPGQATSRYSRGANLLIRNQKAQLILSAEDILEDLMWDLELPHSVRKPVEERDTPLLREEAQIMSCFRCDETLTVDEIVVLTGMDAGTLTAFLVSLELTGLLRQLPGGKYKRMF